MKEKRIRINHRGHGVFKATFALSKVLEVFNSWVEAGEKFHVSIDFDPDWTLLVRFRPSTEEEAEELDSLRPAEEILGKLKSLDTAPDKQSLEQEIHDNICREFENFCNPIHEPTGKAMHGT